MLSNNQRGLSISVSQFCVVEKNSSSYSTLKLIKIYLWYFADIFTQISDSSGYLVKSKFEDYLREVLGLPTAVYEGPSFGFNETAARACFDGVGKHTLTVTISIIVKL